MKKLIKSLLFVSLFLISTNSFSYNSDPKIFIDELINDAIKTLGDKNISKSNKNKKIETIALENVDINALGMYTLGNIRKTLDQNTLKKLVGMLKNEFRDDLSITNVYGYTRGGLLELSRSRNDRCIDELKFTSE